MSERSFAAFASSFLMRAWASCFCRVWCLRIRSRLALEEVEAEVEGAVVEGASVRLRERRTEPVLRFFVVLAIVVGGGGCGGGWREVEAREFTRQSYLVDTRPLST